MGARGEDRHITVSVGLNWGGATARDRGDRFTHIELLLDELDGAARVADLPRQVLQRRTVLGALAHGLQFIEVDQIEWIR